jgi:hypothetical protein
MFSPAQKLRKMKRLSLVGPQPQSVGRSVVLGLPLLLPREEEEDERE